MAVKYGVEYDPKYPWRPPHAWSNCPGCFENFDFNFKCNHCGSGHDNFDPNRTEDETESPAN